MKGPAPLRQVFDAVRDALDRAGAPYAVMGGIAASYWGLPHFTHDLDVAVGVGAADVRAWLRVVEEAGFLVPDHVGAGWTDALAGTRKLTIRRFAEGHVWDVDVFLEDSAFLRSVLARRVVVDLDGRPTPMITAEDLVLFKLMAWRHKDRGHLADLLLVVGPLDESYLRTWAERLGVRDRLAETWSQAGRSPP